MRILVPDFANNEAARKSVSGHCFFLFGCLVSWRSKLQPLTATSTHEAELIALTFAADEGVYRDAGVVTARLRSPDVVPGQSRLAHKQNNALHARQYLASVAQQAVGHLRPRHPCCVPSAIDLGRYRTGAVRDLTEDPERVQLVVDHADVRQAGDYHDEVTSDEDGDDEGDQSNAGDGSEQEGSDDESWLEELKTKVAQRA